MHNCRSLFLYLAVLFEELVEQHRVHFFVAHRERLALVVRDHKIGIHLFHFFGDEPKLRDALQGQALAYSGK